MNNYKILVTTLSLIFFLSCGAQIEYANNLVNPETKDDIGFSLSPEDQEKSKFCGPDTVNAEETFAVGHQFETALIDSLLTGDGLVGHIHGAVPSFQHFSVVYRSPESFFKSEIFSLIPTSPQVFQVLASVNRHDKVKLFGEVFANGSAVKHIKVDRIIIEKVYENPSRPATIPDMSMFAEFQQDKVFGKVHAVVHAEKYGYAVVLDHKGALIPVIVSKIHEKITSELFRNDIVEMDIIKSEGSGNRPPHFTTSPKEGAIKVIDRMINCHKKETTLKGHLVKFFESPSISRDIYAVRVVDENGIGRNFTFFPETENPDEFMELFEGLFSKAEKVWNTSSDFTNSRNYQENKSIKVTVTGKLNITSKSQANPQVYIKNTEKLVIKAL